MCASFCHRRDNSCAYFLGLLIRPESPEVVLMCSVCCVLQLIEYGWRYCMVSEVYSGFQ